MLATLAMFVTGIAVLVVGTAPLDRRHDAGRHEGPRPRHALLRDRLRLAIGAAFLPLEPVWLKWIVAVVLIGIYAWYVKGHFEADPDVDAEDLAPLRFHRLDRGAHRDDPTVPRLRVVNLQVLAALGLIILGAVFFVDAVEHLASQLGRRRASLLALVIAPIATELPEKFNSIIWVRQGKDTLAMGNITGAMVFQSTIPTVVALRLRVEHAGSSRRGRYVGLRLGRHRLPVVGGRSSSRWRAPAACAAGACSIGGVFYLAYLALVIGRSSGVAGVIGGGAPRTTRLIYSGRPHAQEPTRMLTEKSTGTPAPTTHHAPTPGCARRPDLLLRGRTSSRCATPRSAS